MKGKTGSQIAGVDGGEATFANGFSVRLVNIRFIICFRAIVLRWPDMPCIQAMVSRVTVTGHFITPP
ncbi:MAG: hypothetical protein R3208_21545 [Ketobacteraceae bacterium]|nr:hypothetical protein [Ketobacteraceae bacterium]